jgi:DNA-binding CsgD family transcriptional regulator
MPAEIDYLAGRVCQARSRPAGGIAGPGVDRACRSTDTSCVARSLPIVGRAAERDAMSAAYASVAAGQPQVLLRTGEAGIGKTRLIEELIQQAGSAQGGAQVRIGESAPLAGAALAYGPFVAALGERAAWLLADDEPGDMVAARHRLFERMLALLADLAAQAPLVVVLEDLHWADESSHQLLAFLAVRLRDIPVLMVVTLRDEDLGSEAQRWLADLQRRPRVTRLRVAALAPGEVAELVAGLMPEGSGPDSVRAVVRAAEGNPLYALELAGAGAHWPPPSITEAVLAKAAGVAPPVRAVVDQVCVADGGMSHELLAATVPLGEDDLLAAAREAVSRRLLVATADGYAFGHDLIRQVFYGQLLPGERHRLHRRVAEALAARSAPDPAMLSLHWQLADCPERAAPAALVAARQAVSAHAYPEADRFYTLAVEQARWLPEQGPGLLEEAAQAASWAGHPERAAGHTADALAQLADAGPADRVRLLERLGRYRWEAGDPRAAVAATEQARALLEAGEPSVLQARILAALAARRLFLGELDEAMPLALQAVAMAEHVGAVAERAHGLAALGILQAQRGELEAGLATLRTSFTLAHDAGSIEGVIRATTNHTYLLITVGRFTEALDVARGGRRAARRLGAPPGLMWILDNNTAAVLTATGRWAEADQLLADLIGESQANATPYLQLLQLELAVGRGERERAEELATALRKSPEDPRLLGPLHACLAEQALNVGDLATAADEVLDGLAALRGAALPEEEIRLLAAGTRASADLASLPSAARPVNIAPSWEPATASLAERGREIADEHGRGQPVIAAFGALVAAENLRRDGSDNRATWRAVADAWQLLGLPYREAYARLREAAAAVRAGRREQAARALAACESLAGQLPSAPLLAMGGDLARRARLTGQPHQQAPPAAARARFDLTDREADVLALLVKGDSNRQIARALFISDRTVAVHVSRILDKLGVRNRTEAATLGAHLGLTPSSPPPARPDEEPDAQNSPDRR